MFQTFSGPWPCLDKRSASTSYFRTLKHSNLSSKYKPYVRTQAEQSQAAHNPVSKTRKSWGDKQGKGKISTKLEILTNWTGVILKVWKLQDPSPLCKVEKLFSKCRITLTKKSMDYYKCFQSNLHVAKRINKINYQHMKPENIFNILSHNCNIYLCKSFTKNH